MILRDLTAQQFNRLTVIERSKLAHKQVHWVCRCSCGNITTVSRHNLVRGGTKSCGCHRRQFFPSLNTTHGLSRTPEYKTWKGIRDRCSNPKSKSFQWYGAVGVQVCERWNQFENFYADMGDRPPGTSIDRIDPFGDYEPGNCRWTDPVTQRNNRRDCCCK